MKNHFHALRHGRRLSWLAMVVSGEMKNTMNEQIHDHLVFCITQFGSIIRGPVRTNHHIAQEILACADSLPFLLRERENIGRAFFTAVSIIQVGHFRCIHQYDGERRGLFTIQAF